MGNLSRLAGLLLLLIGAIGTTSVAFAHAELRSAYPEIGAAYRWERPSEIRLSFTQSLLLEGSSIMLVNRQFEAQQVGAVQIDAEDPTTMFVTLPELDTGTYTVNWVTASIDGHTIQGSYDFTLLPREAVYTLIIAVVVFSLMGLLVWRRRAP